MSAYTAVSDQGGQDNPKIGYPRETANCTPDSAVGSVESSTAATTQR